MKMENRNRAMLLAVVGTYVIYLAYQMMRDQLDGKSSMAMWLCILAVVFFGIAGITVLILAWKISRKKDEEEEEQKETPEDGKALK